MSQQAPLAPQKLIADYRRLLRYSPSSPGVTASVVSEALPARNVALSCALLLSPHPDDECLTGALPIRLRHENWQIVNIAVTLGSDVDRREPRVKELARACTVLGFDCALPQAGGFENISPESRDAALPQWHTYVARLATIIAHYQPQAIFMPHAQDGHIAHIGTHLLGMDALAKQPLTFSCNVIQTEYWHPIAEPNLMVAIDEEDTAILLSALSCHVGEVARSPYDARFPAFLIDNVRRGSERVGGKGMAQAAMDFAMLYRFGVWSHGKFVPSALNRLLKTDAVIAGLF